MWFKKRKKENSEFLVFCETVDGNNLFYPFDTEEEVREVQGKVAENPRTKIFAVYRLNLDHSTYSQCLKIERKNKIGFC